LVRSAYTELSRVSACLGATKGSWCTWLRGALEDLGLGKLWKSQSVNLIMNYEKIFIEKLMDRSKTEDWELAKKSTSTPHYTLIKSTAREEPYLNLKLPFFVVRRILQLRLNFNSIFQEGKWVDLGMWDCSMCRYCPEQRSFFHSIFECKDDAILRSRIVLGSRSLLSDHLSLLKELSVCKFSEQEYLQLHIFMINTINRHL